MKNDSERKDGSNQFLKTDGGKTKSNAIEIPSIALPQGGGSIKGIDEKFSVNAVNGTASFSIPLPFSPARGVTPSVTLSYNSGNGNGIFGLGWNISLPSIKRKTDKGLPQYQDETDSDVFLFSEAEDLVPAFSKDAAGAFRRDENGEYIVHEQNSPDDNYRIRYYKPRIEGLFARIERWTELATGIIKWRVITKDNITTLLGWSEQSVVADPTDRRRIFEWLPEFVFDDKGNCSHYQYAKENAIGFDPASLHNRNRFADGEITYTNQYVQKVLYGNKTPYINMGDGFPPETDFVFQTLFDYGEYNPDSPYDKIADWRYRTDAFSGYKAGFEIRTTRLCQRVLLYHYFNELPGGFALIRSTDFVYDTSTEQDFTFLKSAATTGYIKRNDGSYSAKKLPAMEFEYQQHDWNKDVRTIAADDLVHAPAGLSAQGSQFTDLYNEGLSGILSEQGDGWYYKENLGGGHFNTASRVSPKPSFAGLGQSFALMDLDADGGKQLVSYDTLPQGYFELDNAGEWESWRTFQGLPLVDFKDAHTRMIDLDGDGRPDLMISEDFVFTWYASEGRSGFLPARRTPKPFDEEAGPHIVFEDETQSIFLADMSGDGLTDIVRIRNGEVCYWPNLGYGRFGTKVGMDHAPVFDHADTFNPAYLRLADIDGSGTTDIIYLGKNNFSCWKNLSGNSFSTSPFTIEPFPSTSNASNVLVTDLLGNGVTCIVWTSDLPGDTGTALRYVDLMNSRKPHVLISYRNNTGKEVSLSYTPSTRFYLDDKVAGNPWVTKLHFPVHCLSKIEVADKISGHRFVSSYKYHHGYYDHAEREFRGFGMVEQIDAEDFEHWVKGDATNIVEAPLHQEPVVSRTWFHTGAFQRREKILTQFEHEYWFSEMERHGFNATHRETPLRDARLVTAPGMEEHVVDNLSAHEWREALRACKGMILRSEVFAKDAARFENTDEARRRECIPYSVATHNCIIELLQPKGKNRFAVFTVKESESITYAYERNPEDPRIAHSLNIVMDEYGNVLESASVIYPRFVQDTSLPADTQQEQAKLKIVYTHNQLTNDVTGDNVHRLRLPAEITTFELKDIARTGSLYIPDDFENVLSTAIEIPYHQVDMASMPGQPRKRLLEKVRTVYYRNDLQGSLSLRQLESRAFVFENYQLAYTTELLYDIFGSRVSAGILSEGQYTHSEGDENWWVRSGTAQYVEDGESLTEASTRFFTPVSFTDPYGAKTIVHYDETYHLFVKDTVDALGNKTSVDLFNFRTFSPRRMKDINGNLSEVLTDELGLVKALAVYGKGDEADSLQGQEESTGPDEMQAIEAFLAAPDSTELSLRGAELLQRATARFVYDFDVYTNTGKPIAVASIVREQHAAVNVNSPVQIAFEYTSGLGKVVMKKVQAEPGIARQVTLQDDTSILISEVDTAGLNPKQLRWIGNGRTILNNKGNVVKQYEPYFAVTHRYEDLKELVEVGVTPVMYYDPMGRLIRTNAPDETFSKVVFDSWKQMIFDGIDTLNESPWYAKRTNRLIDIELLAEEKDPVREKEAADQSYKYVNTPTLLHLDTGGRPVLSVEHNRHTLTNVDEYYATRTRLDIEGNLRQVVDARGNIVMQYKYDMLGNLVYQNSMDSGQRWILTNIVGSPLRTWDERNHEFQYAYDILHRPVFSKVLGGDGAVSLDHIVDRFIYGENLLEPGRANEAALNAKNVIGKPIRHYDTGGLLETPEYDFKGQPVTTQRRLFKKYKETANWMEANLSADLEPDVFTFTTETDALGRIVRQVIPDESVITPSYNEAGLFNSEKILHADADDETIYIKDIDYNEKGQRSKIIYGNDAFTKFYYDSVTLRLKRLETRRKNNEALQDLYYTYDPVGNITHIEDRSIPVTFYNNQKITGSSRYTYDALYRLVEATGRENNVALAFDNKDNWNDSPFMQSLAAGSPMAMRQYTQQYKYDSVGNLLQMRHTATANQWTRNYAYEPASNRLKSTTQGSHTYTYPHHDRHGYITAMPHLEDIGWSFKEELVKSIRQRRTDGGTPETTYYQYDGQGKRLRKITENEADADDAPALKDERIYVSIYELYKIHSGSNAGLERSTISLVDRGHRYVMIDSETEPRRVLGIPFGRTSPKETIRYQLHNHLGSSALELDEDADVISYEEYHPFGTTAYQAKNADIDAAAKRYRYTGMERDEETGLEYHGARYYIPWLARWISADPIGIGDGFNVFSYVRNSPLARKDSKGSEGEKWDKVETEDPNASYYIGEKTGFFRRDTGQFSEVWDPESSDSVVVFGDDKIVGSNKNVQAPSPAVTPPDDQTEAAEEEAKAEEAEDVQVEEVELKETSWRDNKLVQLSAGLILGGLQGWIPFGFVANVAPVPTKEVAIGRAVGEMAMGVAQTIVGGFGVGGGTAVSVTGVGAVVGVPAAIGGTVVLAQGLTNITAGSLALNEALKMESSSSSGGGSKAPDKEVIDQDKADLAKFRKDLTLPESGTPKDKSTLAKLTIGDKSYMGINAHGQTTDLRVNAISKTHAEMDVFQQAAKDGVKGGTGRLVVDRELCKPCGDFGAVKSLAKQLGLKELFVSTPTKNFFIPL